VADQLSNDLASLRLDREERPARGGAIVRVLVVLALVGGIAYGAMLAWPHVEARVFATEVEIGTISTVSPAQAQTQLTAIGHVVARTLAHVSSSVAARVVAVRVVEGQRVAQGDTLVELDGSDQATAIASSRARLQAAQARLAQARATLAQTQLNLDRTRNLVTRGASPHSQQEDLEAQVAVLESAVGVAQADVHTSQSELHALEVNRGDFTIEAPLAGVVITDPVEIGEMVSPSQELMQIADFDSIVVEVDVPEGRLSLVTLHGPCEIVLDAFPGRRFRGEASEIGSRVNRSTAAVPVRVRFAEDDSMVLPDMSAHVSFLREALSDDQVAAQERTVVPTRAITQRGGRDVVLVIENNVVHERPVRTGDPMGDGLVMTSGPEVGARLVLDPPDTLGNGQHVREREQ
jgi:RND family efflux transporter MFP subunit